MLIEQLETIGIFEVVIRILIASLFGFLLGYDRYKKDKPISYQSYIIITVITCLLAIMGGELYENYNQAENAITIDLGKIISGTLTGIGFLGAGAIIKRDKDYVEGAATGASIWAAGGLGLLLGFGFYSLSILGFVVIWLTLMLPKLLRKSN